MNRLARFATWPLLTSRHNVIRPPSSLRISIRLEISKHLLLAEIIRSKRIVEITRGGHPVKRAVTREIFIPRPELFNSIVDRRPRYENTLPLVHYSRHEQLSNLIPVYTTRGEMENDMIFDVNFYSVLLREERMSWSIFPRSHVCNIAHRDHRRSSKRIGRFPVNGRRLMAMPCRVADRRSHLPHNFSLVSLILLLPFFSLVSNSNNLILS